MQTKAIGSGREPHPRAPSGMLGHQGTGHAIGLRPVTDAALHKQGKEMQTRHHLFQQSKSGGGVRNGLPTQSADAPASTLWKAAR